MKLARPASQLLLTHALPTACVVCRSRTKRVAGIKSLDIYALALYVDPAAARAALAPKFRGAAAPAVLAGDQALFDGGRAAGRAWLHGCTVGWHRRLEGSAARRCSTAARQARRAGDGWPPRHPPTCVPSQNSSTPMAWRRPLKLSSPQSEHTAPA